MSRPTPRTYKTRNWPAYNKALKRRGSGRAHAGGADGSNSRRHNPGRQMDGDSR